MLFIKKLFVILYRKIANAELSLPYIRGALGERRLNPFAIPEIRHRIREVVLFLPVRVFSSSSFRILRKMRLNIGSRREGNEEPKILFLYLGSILDISFSDDVNRGRGGGVLIDIRYNRFII